MGGMQFFYRITLLEGRGESGMYRFEECSIPHGEEAPSPVPYRNIGTSLDYFHLMKRLFGPVREEAGQRISELSPSNPVAELYHDHHSSI